MNKSCDVCDTSEQRGCTINNCPNPSGTVHMCDDCLKEFGAVVGNLIVRVTPKFEQRFLAQFSFEFPRQF